MQLLEDNGCARPGICSEHNQWCTVQQSFSADEQDHYLSSSLFQASIISRGINRSVAAGDCTGVVAYELATSDWIEKSVSCQLDTEMRAMGVRHRHDAGDEHAPGISYLQVQWPRLPPKNENLWLSCSATFCAPWKKTQKLSPPLMSLHLKWSS